MMAGFSDRHIEAMQALGLMSKSPEAQHEAVVLALETPPACPACEDQLVSPQAASPVRWGMVSYQIAIHLLAVMGLLFLWLIVQALK